MNLMIPQPSRIERFNAVSRIMSAFKAKPSQRIIALSQPMFPFGATPQYFDRTFPNYVKDGYKRNELVYACISATANTVASVSLKVHDKRTNDVDEKSGLRELIERPNQYWDEFDLWVTVIVHMKLAGVAYIQKIRNAAGQVISLWPIRPDYVRQNRTAADGLTSYTIHIGGVDLQEIDGRDMMRFALPDPLDMFAAQSPIEVLSRSADVDNSLTDFLKLFMDRGGVPQSILTSKLRLDDDAIVDIQRRWEDKYGGYRNWMKAPAVLDSDATYQRIGLSFNEMKFEHLDGRNEARICMVMQVPPIIVGSAMGLARSTFSNYGEARKAWWEDTLMALYKRISNVVNQQLAPDFQENVIAEWDFTNVPALQEERSARWARATAAFAAGVITRNMALEEMGLENVGKEGEVFVVSATAASVPDDPRDNRPANTFAPVAEDDTTEGKTVKAKRILEAPVTTPDDLETKALTSDNAEAVVPHGAPLPSDAALVVPGVKKTEIDHYFDLYAKLKAEHSKNGKVTANA